MTLWVFGYGSLLWNPGFEVVESVPARLTGYARSFCMWSIHHRGTEADPGLVLALDKVETATCDGMAFRAQDGQEKAVLGYLRERELVSSAYLETWQQISLSDGRSAEAVAYVIDPDHVQYCHLSLEKQAQIIAKAVGGRGPNTEYLHKTYAQLVQMGIEDAELEWLDARVRALTA